MLHLRQRVQTDVTKPLPNIPVLIFTYSEQPDPALHEQAWAAALVLMGFVLVASLAAKALLAREGKLADDRGHYDDRP